MALVKSICTSDERITFADCARCRQCLRFKFRPLAISLKQRFGDGSFTAFQLRGAIRCDIARQDNGG